MRNKCALYEDGCEEWAGCPCVYYKAIKNEECKHWTDEKCLYYGEQAECHHCEHKKMEGAEEWQIK